jgi:hypothetical protein
MARKRLIIAVAVVPSAMILVVAALDFRAALIEEAQEYGKTQLALVRTATTSIASELNARIAHLKILNASPAAVCSTRARRSSPSRSHRQFLHTKSVKF